MSSLAEVYAKDLGVKITKPTITDHYFPIYCSRYICCDRQTDIQSQQYEHWEVINKLLKPIFADQDIGVIEIPKGITNKQKNFIIKKSLMYFGVANHFVNIADSYELPSVSIMSNMYEQNFNLFNKAKVITPDFTEIKPSYSGEENPKRINEIKPEQIAQSILDGLGIKQKINFKTIRVGSNFQNDAVEIEPNFFAHSDELVGKPVNVRGDLHFDLANISNWCTMCIVNLYVSDPFNIEALNTMPNLKQLVFKYEKRHEESELSSFFKNLKNKKVQLIIQTKDEEILSDLRLKYFDYNVVFEEQKPDISKEIPKTCKYMSKKKFVLNAEVYNSESSAKRLDKSNNFVYDDTSKSEIESFYIYDEE